MFTLFSSLTPTLTSRTWSSWSGTWHLMGKNHEESTLYRIIGYILIFYSMFTLFSSLSPTLTSRTGSSWSGTCHSLSQWWKEWKQTLKDPNVTNNSILSWSPWFLTQKLTCSWSRWPYPQSQGWSQWWK